MREKLSEYELGLKPEFKNWEQDNLIAACAQEYTENQTVFDEKQKKQLMINLLAQILLYGGIHIADKVKFEQFFQLACEEQRYPDWVLENIYCQATANVQGDVVYFITSGYFHRTSTLEKAIDRKDPFVEWVYPGYFVEQTFHDEQAKHNIRKEFEQLLIQIEKKLKNSTQIQQLNDELLKHVEQLFNERIK